MGYYISDREFTDYVHDNLAIPLIYNHLSWFPQDLNTKLSVNVDMSNAVDQFMIDDIHKKIVTVQERFREYKYHYYDDFTYFHTLLDTFCASSFFMGKRRFLW